MRALPAALAPSPPLQMMSPEFCHVGRASLDLLSLFVFQQEDPWHTRVSDVRSQLRFLEEVETLKKKRNDEEERERLLLMARVNWTQKLP